MTLETRPSLSVVEMSVQSRKSSADFQLGLQEVQNGSYEITRGQFGPGKSGQRSYNAVLSIREIISRIDNGLYVSERESIVAEMDRCSFIKDDNSRCNSTPTGTVNFDVRGEEDIVLVCSREHGDKIAKSLEEQAIRQGTSTVTARNGWGRA